MNCRTSGSASICSACFLLAGIATVLEGRCRVEDTAWRARRASTGSSAAGGMPSGTPIPLPKVRKKIHGPICEKIGSIKRSSSAAFHAARLPTHGRALRDRVIRRFTPARLSGRCAGSGATWSEWTPCGYDLAVYRPSPYYNGTKSCDTRRPEQAQRSSGG